ncbi:MAG TPA: glycosyltransferase [Vicinamibacterales bacterium]|nr:glycosyltransferase [Vicinamibacterales bacterium]
MAEPLRIFVTADPEVPVPPKLYGGIERVIALLVNGLVERGHAVTLFAHPESQVRSDLIGYAGRRSGSAADTMKIAAQIGFEAARRHPDVIHSFGRLAYLLPVLPLPIPKIMSYQRAVTARSVEMGTRLSRGTLSFTACSRQLMRAVDGPAWQVVYNAVDTTQYQFEPQVPADAPLMFLGRVERIKGPHLAIEVARKTRRRLILAGNIPEGEEHRVYFKTEIEPHVDGREIMYAGPVDDAMKSELLSQVSALLMPVLWNEPFGIVMAEALACGTPVIGLSRGAIPEVVADGVTGFVCLNADEMAEAVGRVASIDRRACRDVAERRFSQPALVNAYETLYRRVARTGSVPADVREAQLGRER